MKLYAIAAVAQNQGIGLNGAIPWHIPGDLASFKRKTTSHAIIMGRKTWESIGRRRLPLRTNIVVSSSPDLREQGAFDLQVASLGDAIAAAGAAGHAEAWVIGGARLYEEAIPLLDGMFITSVDLAPECDAFFPALREGAWEVVSDLVFLADGGGTPTPAHSFTELRPTSPQRLAAPGEPAWLPAPHV